MSTLRAYPPLPVREDWTPAYLSARGDANRDFAFNLRDAQGAPSLDGNRYHSAVDIFAPGGSPVVSPVAGRVYQVDASRGWTGQVFGGVVRILEPSGVLWVLRHVEPCVSVGQEAIAGEAVASVTPWRDGGPHLHLEIWRTPTGGYRHENMIDPREVEWTTAAILEREPDPLPHGNTLRLVVHGHPKSPWAGWDECRGPLRWIAEHGLAPVPPLAKGDHAIAWRGNVWRGHKDVTNVARHLVRKYLNQEEN